MGPTNSEVGQTQDADQVFTEENELIGTFYSIFGTSEQSPHDEESYPTQWSCTWYADCVQRITPEGVGQIKIRDQRHLFV